jgi:tRNA U34 5-methylaminomethyl-2-thiouridine-forming methyltransferase MnmC
MNRYLVESTHAAADCHHVVEQFVYHGHVMNFDWGCEAGVHTSWAIVESENESEALLSVPAHLRSKARAIRLTKFTPEKLQQAHE